MQPCCPSHDAHGAGAAYAVLRGCCRNRPPVHWGKLTPRASALTPWGRVRPTSQVLQPCSSTLAGAALGSDLSSLWTWVGFPDKPQIPPNPPRRFLQDMHRLVPPHHPCPGACRTQTSRSFPKRFSLATVGAGGVQLAEQSQAWRRKSGRRGWGGLCCPGQGWGPAEHHPGALR